MLANNSFLCQSQIALSYFQQVGRCYRPPMKVTCAPCSSHAVRVVARFDDIAMVRQPVQQRRGHLGVAKHGRPFREAQVGGGDDDAGVLIQFGEQVEQKRAAGLAEGRSPSSSIYVQFRSSLVTAPAANMASKGCGASQGSLDRIKKTSSRHFTAG